MPSNMRATMSEGSIFDLSESKRVMEKELNGKSVNHLCIPGGRKSPVNRTIKKSAVSDKFLGY
jgi:hypothetical protein